MHRSYDDITQGCRVVDLTCNDKEKEILFCQTNKRNDVNAMMTILSAETFPYSTSSLQCLTEEVLIFLSR